MRIGESVCVLYVVLKVTCHVFSCNTNKLLFVQRTSQVAVGGASMRKELFGNEPVTSEDHVSCNT